MNLYKITLSHAAVGNWLVAATNKKQAVGLVVDNLNWRWRQRGITYQTTDFAVKEIDIDSIQNPTIL